MSGLRLNEWTEDEQLGPDDPAGERMRRLSRTVRVQGVSNVIHDWITAGSKFEFSVTTRPAHYVACVGARRHGSLRPETLLISSEWFGEGIDITPAGGASWLVSVSDHEVHRRAETSLREWAALATTGSPPLSEIERSVLAELSDPRWKFRTAAGIARHVGVPEEIVHEALGRLGTKVRRPLAPDPSGRELFTVGSRRPSWHERYLAAKHWLSTY